jgi:hypothetical protein
MVDTRIYTNQTLIITNLLNYLCVFVCPERRLSLKQYFGIPIIRDNS